MSTHTIGGGNSGLEESTVTLKATQGSEPAPEVNVYVERLAAKIRINEYNGNNFVYTIEHDDMFMIVPLLLYMTSCSSIAFATS